MMQIILANLPALQIVLPFLAAPICFVLSRGTVVWSVAFIVTIAAFAISCMLFLQVSVGEVVTYAMGGWEPPWGIEFRIDSLNAIMLLLVSAMAVMALAFGRKSVEKEIPKHAHPVFYSAFLLCFAGLLGIVITGDAFNLFVFLEISSLASYILISYCKDRRSLSAAFQYLVMGTIGATMLLIGIGFLYMMTGTLNMVDLASRLPEISDTRTVRAAFAFIIVGLSIKLALFPLHIWLPNAYSYAPSVVTVFLAATSTKVALYAILRFVYTVFGAEFAFGEMQLQVILITLSILAILSCSLSAMFQSNIKHLLAYSSVAQIGYIVIGIGLFSVAGLGAGLLHLFNHAIMKGCLFMAVGCVFYQYGSARIEDFKGLGKTMPYTMAAFVIGGLGLIGMPLTAGFISKWYLISAALEFGSVGFVIIATILAGSLLAVAYVWRVVEVAYFQAPENDERNEAPLALLLPTWCLALATIYFGIQTQFNVGAAMQAAQMLSGGAQ